MYKLKRDGSGKIIVTYWYWACACGDSPINGYFHTEPDASTKPERCNNIHHEPGRADLPMNIRLVKGEKDR